MQRAAPYSLFAPHYRFIFGSGVVTALIVVIISLLLPLEYRASVRLFVSPVISSSGVVYDQYTALKTAEQISDTLGSVVRTMLFQSKVLGSSYGEGLDIFSDELRVRQREWWKKIDTISIKGVGVLLISAFDEDKVMAEKFSRAVAETLVLEGSHFLPGKVTIRIVDPPIVSRFPVRPHLPFRALFGFVFGGLVASVYLYVAPHSKLHDEFRLIP